MKNNHIHEECGVFGIYSPFGKIISYDIYNGLIALQHRGQESAGISVSNTLNIQSHFITKKGMGLVNEVFNSEEIKQMQGNIGIGHVRYSTTGDSILENAQPITMNYIKGSLAIVHNGNIMNAYEIKETQMLHGQAHYTTSDTEILIYEIINERINTSSIETNKCSYCNKC